MRFFESQEETYRKIKSGDMRTISRFYKDNFPKIEWMVRRNSGNEEEAKDVFQDAFVSFYNRIVTGKFIPGKEKLSTHLYRIANWKWKDNLKSKKRRPLVGLEEKDEARAFLSQFENEWGDNLDAYVEQGLKLLGEKCRELLTMFYFDNFSLADIAEELAFNNSNTAKSKKNKCLNKFRELVLDLIKQG